MTDYHHVVKVRSTAKPASFAAVAASAAYCAVLHGYQRVQIEFRQTSRGEPDGCWPRGTASIR
jgi:hypothetical protein